SGAVHRRHAPEAHDGGGRRALRGDDGRRRRLAARLAPPPARRRHRRDGLSLRPRMAWRAGPAAVVLVLCLAGCGAATRSVPTDPNGAAVPTAGVARARLETYIASDIRERALAAHIGHTVTVHSVRCRRRDRIHYVCRIRSSS